MPQDDEYSEFESVQGGDAPGTIENQLPNETPASAFRYRKFIDAFYSFNSIDLSGGGGSAVVTGRWKIQILDGPNGAVLFEQEVELRFLVIVQVIAGQVGFFFWSPLDTGNGLISTSIVGGQEVPKDSTGKYEGWRFVDTSTPTPFVEFGNTEFDFADTGSFTLEGGVIRATWVSPAYKMDVPPGCFLNVVFDHWQVGALRESTYQFSFKAGAAQVDAVFDDYGALWHASTKDGQVRVATAFGPYKDLRAIGWIGDAREASINTDKTGRVWLLVKQADGWWEYSSSDGHTLEKGERIWDKNANMARTLFTDEGTRISMAFDGNDLVYKEAGADGAAASKIATVSKRQPFTPAVDREGNIYAIGEDGVEYTSGTGGAGDWVE
jgi:hypothetical protein